MTYDIDFLPASYRRSVALRSDRRLRFLLAGTVVVAAGATEVTFLRRGGSLERMGDLAWRHAATVTLHAERATLCKRRRQGLLDEIEQWAVPLRAERAAVPVEVVLRAEFGEALPPGDDVRARLAAAYDLELRTYLDLALDAAERNADRRER